MIQRSLRQLRQPFACLAVLMMLFGAVSPAFASPGAVAEPSASAQDGATASIQLNAYTCDSGTMPTGGSLAAAEAGSICPTVAAAVDFTLQQDGAETVQATDAQGATRFEFAAGGSVKFWAGVPLEADEALYCATGEATDGQLTAVTIDGTGVSTFDTSTATSFTCAWFVANDQPAEEAAPATESPAADEAAAESTLDLLAFDCAADAVSDPATASYDDLVAACAANTSGIEFHLNTGDVELTQAIDGNGRTEFAYPAGAEVDFYASVPLESVEVLHCSVAMGAPEALTRDDQGVFHWANTAAEERTCSWFLIAPPVDEPTEAPATVAPTEVVTEQPTELPVTLAPTEAVTTEAPTVPAATETLPGAPEGDSPLAGEIRISPMVCPVGFDADESGTDLGTLAANCTEPVADVSFTLGSEGGWSNTRVSSTTEPIVWSGLEAGSYTLFSSVPLESASQYLGCTADGGDLYQKDFTAEGVTTFVDLETEQIDCTWYIVPENSRGDQTGASVEIHLAACPAGFDGDDPFEACHSNGLAGYDFTVEGPDGAQTAATAILKQDGPGVVTFASLVPGDYTITGGPPGHDGTVKLFCSNQPANGEPEYSIDGAIASLTLAENQHVLCDWYFVPTGDGTATVTPTATTTPEPARAEILVTLLACPAGTSGAYSGASLDQLQQQCTEKVNDVTFRLSSAGGVPISAETGLSGDGAVRFYDLLPGDLTMTPALGSSLRSLAVFCTIGDGDPYQKALANGGTTFVDLEGESITCSWFAVKSSPPATGGGDTGSITIREYLCEKDQSEITDWDAECTPGSTGSTFTIANTSNGEAKSGTPDAKGIHVFGGLPDGLYTLTQGTGRWCRAVADRVDDKSRVIVQGGGNTDVVLYQCNAVDNLPVTGAGTSHLDRQGDDDGLPLTSLALLGASLPLVAVAVWRAVRQPERIPVRVTAPVVDQGRWWHRYR